MDPCSPLYAVGVGILLFALLYFVRRFINWLSRRNAEEDLKNGKNVPHELEWGLDHTDRSFIRAAIASSLVTMLLCWFQGRKTIKSYTSLEGPRSIDTSVYRGGVFDSESLRSDSSLGPSNFETPVSSGERRVLLTPDSVPRAPPPPPLPQNNFRGMRLVSSPTY